MKYVCNKIIPVQSAIFNFMEWKIRGDPMNIGQWYDLLWRQIPSPWKITIHGNSKENIIFFSL